MSMGFVPGQSMSAFPQVSDGWDSWRQLQQAVYSNNLEGHMLTFYHNAGCGIDVNSAPRRKNATRETTSMLKAWLNEHRKNPYPTKGEKIMLAIITKMTLTQVSTWFANARRRLKKENKMTWLPRTRSDEEPRDISASGSCHLTGAGTDPGENLDDADDDVDLDADSDLVDDVNDHDEDDDESGRPDVEEYEAEGREAPTTLSKPKIWSLVDMATKDGEKHSTSSSAASSCPQPEAAAIGPTHFPFPGLPVPVGIPQLPGAPPHFPHLPPGGLNVPGSAAWNLGKMMAPIGFLPSPFPHAPPTTSHPGGSSGLPYPPAFCSPFLLQSLGLQQVLSSRSRGCGPLSFVSTSDREDSQAGHKIPDSSSTGCQFESRGGSHLSSNSNTTMSS